MRRPALNLVVDAIAFAGFVFMTASGVLLRFVLPPGSGHRTSIWGLNRHEWGGIHYLDGCRASGRALGARRDAREVDRAHGSWPATRRLRHPGRAGSRRPGGDPGAGRRIAFQPGRAGRTHTTAGSARLLARGRPGVRVSPPCTSARTCGTRRPVRPREDGMCRSRTWCSNRVPCLDVENPRGDLKRCALSGIEGRRATADRGLRLGMNQPETIVRVLP